jgi:hypothetical protein
MAVSLSCEDWLAGVAIFIAKCEAYDHLKRILKPTNSPMHAPTAVSGDVKCRPNFSLTACLIVSLLGMTSLRHIDELDRALY